MSLDALSETQKKTVAVDCDGVLASWAGGWQGINHFGDPIPDAVEFTHFLGQKYRVLIHTCRLSREKRETQEEWQSAYDALYRWLKAHGFHFDEIWTGTCKPVACAYVDDRAVACNPEQHHEWSSHRCFKEALTAIEALAGERS